MKTKERIESLKLQLCKAESKHADLVEQRAEIIMEISDYPLPSDANRTKTKAFKRMLRAKKLLEKRIRIVEARMDRIRKMLSR